MEGLSPAEILRRANNVLAMRNERSTFVTTFCGFLDVSTGHVAYANGGHNPPAKLDGDGGVEFLEMGGIALGAMDGMSYEERELTLQPGQGLLLYTDGVNEATNAQDELFEDERLVSALQLPHRKMTAEMITANLRQKVAEFVLEAPPSDDITAVAILYRGPVKTGN
jgi:sigma-B regulation protein RsbU (phosphoserine phosphatase)